ncbi:MAG: trehalose-phosphatase [Actinomycetota bacterium]
MDLEDAIDRLREDPASTGIFLDFDGTLSAIVPRPEDASLVRGAREALQALAERYALVAIVSGRALEDLRKRIGVQGVVLAGAYGRERSDRKGRRATEGWETVAFAASAGVGHLDGVVIERKGAGIAMHFRASPEHSDAVHGLASDLAAEYGLEVRPGRKVVELVVPGPGKGDAIVGLIAERGLERVLVAGDDWGDLDAFSALREQGHDAVIAAVASEEAPPGLTDLADVVVAGPPQLVALLAQLTR